ncbi:MAG: hypothetical protein ACTH6A_06570 [Brachybacterium tyrofermentans]|uniref:hypothetical protein n=1 Tax=Brachybacterium tyrofermentans TaxID=47848 RepID=UPI003F906796
MNVIGTFVATFPLHGGMSPQRIRRATRPDVYAIAERQGVVITAELQYRLDRTRTGQLVVVQAEAFSTRPVAEVRKHAEVMAYEHEVAHPAMAGWIGRHLRAVRS